MIASHVNRWTGLPYGIKSEELELMLIDYDSVAFFNCVEGQYILPYRDLGGRNVYNKPIAIEPVPFNGSQLTLIKNKDPDKTIPPLILWDNSSHDSFDRYLRHFSLRLEDIQKSIQILEKKLRMPAIVAVNEDNEESYLSIISDIESGNPVIVVEQGQDIRNAITSFDMQTRIEPLRALWEDYNKIEGEIYILLGSMYNVEQGKAAGVGKAETVVNYSPTFAIASGRLQQRQDWAAEVNAIYGTNIWCEKSNDIEDIIGDMMNGKKLESSKDTERKDEEEKNDQSSGV
jgi:hypothetical protein